MTYKIGFLAERADSNAENIIHTANRGETVPKKSVVQVWFPETGTSLAYYNDKFDLRCGDLVYVEGKLEGVLGRVTEVSCNFKIRLSDYKRVTALVDTDVKGRFYMAGSHFVTFERGTLPASKVVNWFKAPENGDDDFVSGTDDTSFFLSDPCSMKVSDSIAERGHDYYMENKVKYICLDGSKGYAVVEGSKSYEVEFEYNGGRISNLVCTCFCSYNCKHEFAAMLQLRETLEFIENHYDEEFRRTGYFAAVVKSALFAFAIDNSRQGSFTIDL